MCGAQTFKDFPPSALSLLESLLAFESECRGSTTSSLHSDFFTTKPLPCDPSSLPKYPPSKEFNAKLRDEETKRLKSCGGKGGGAESSRKGSKESKAVPAPLANAELQASILKWKGQLNPKSNSENFNPIGKSLDVVDEGPHLNSRRAYDSQRSFKPQATAARLSRFSNSVAASGGSSQLDFSRDSSVHSHWPYPCLNTRYEHMNDAEPSNHLLGTLKNNGQGPRKEMTNGYALQKTRMHNSGPLLPPGGSVEEMLKDHEKQIQIAVRKARIDKNKNKKGHPDYGQTDSLLEYCK